jgi:hypothetical protein
MIDQQKAMTDAICTSIELLHQKMVLGGYEEAEAIHQDFLSLRSAMTLKRVAGQDWSPPSESQHREAMEEFRNKQINHWKTDVPDMIVVSAEPYFDEQQRREWSAVFAVRYEQIFFTFASRMGPWTDPKIFHWSWQPTHQLDRGMPALDLNEEEEEQLVIAVNRGIYSALEQFHTQHSASGFAAQRDAYQRFVQKVPGQGYMVEGTERFQVASTNDAFGDDTDPEDLETAFRQSWAIAIKTCDVLAAEHFPLEDGRDRWFVAYQLRVAKFTFNAFVKFYSHRKPQVEIIYS